MAEMKETVVREDSEKTLECPYCGQAGGFTTVGWQAGIQTNDGHQPGRWTISCLLCNEWSVLTEEAKTE